MSQKPLKVVAYIRKSTSGTGENGVAKQEGSFDRQRAEVEDYAKRKGFVIAKWYEDEASGKTLRKRKRFLEMVLDAKAGKFKAILFGEYDRFMRDVKEAKRYEVMFDELGVESKQRRYYWCHPRTSLALTVTPPLTLWDR